MPKTTGMPRVLHVDDLRSFLDVFEFTFSKNFDITSATKVDKALDLLRSEYFDALVTDYDMPDKNGIELMHLARTIRPGLPVIFVTAQGNEEVAREVFISGASDYFTKKLNGFALREKLVNSIINLVKKQQAENALEESQNRYKAVFETSGSGMMLFEPSGLILLTNRKMKQLAGLPSAKPSGDLKWQDVIEPEDHSIFSRSIARLSFNCSDSAVNFECRLKVPGPFVHFLVSASRVTDCQLIVVSFQNITHRIENENRLRREWTILDKIIQLNPYSVAIFDRDGHFVRANRQYEKLFPTLPPPTYCLFKDPILIREGIMDKLDDLKSGKMIETRGIWYNIHEIDSNQPDHRIFLKSNGFPIMDESGQLEYVVAIHEDFTYHRIKEDKLLNSRQELTEMVAERTRELEKANEHLRREITERKKIDEALRRSEERHRLIANMAPVGIMLHDKEKIIFINEEGAEILGSRTPGQFLGKPIISLVHPDRQNELKHLINEIFKRKKPPRNFMYDLKTPDGSNKNIHMSAARVKLENDDFLLVIATQLSGQPQLDSRSLCVEEQLRKILKKMNAPIYTISTNQQIISTNNTLQELIGWPDQDLVGRDLKPLVHPDDRPVVAEYFRRSATGEQLPPYEARVKNARGEYSTLLCRFTPLTVDGKVLEVIGTFSFIENTSPREQDNHETQPE